MRRFLLLLLVAALGILSFGSQAMAEGFTGYIDYSISDYSGPGDMSALTLGGEYAVDRFFFGGWFGFDAGFHPTPFPQDYTGYGIYGAYTLLGDDCLNLSAVVGYFASNPRMCPGPWLDDKLTSGAVGLRGGLNFDPIEITAMYMFGITNRYRWYVGGVQIFDSVKVRSSYLELKGAYKFSDSFGAYLLYRTVNWDVKPLYRSIDAGGFGLGFQFTF